MVGIYHEKLGEDKITNKHLLKSVVSGTVPGTDNQMMRQNLFPWSLNSDRKRQAINKQISGHKLYQIGTNAMIKI